MKRVFILGIMMLLLVPFVFAGDSTDIDLFTGSTQAVYMSEGDEVRFYLNDDLHAIYIEDIADTAVKFRIAPTLSNTTQTYIAFVSLDTIVKVDLEQDGVDDLNVALYAVDDEGIAAMVFQLIGDNEITGDVGVVIDEEKSNKNIYLTVIGVVVGILVVILLFVNLGKGEELPEVKEEVKEEPKPQEIAED